MAHRRWRLIWLRCTRWVTVAAVAVFLMRQWADLEMSATASYQWVLGVLPSAPSWLPSAELLRGQAALTAGALGVVALGALVYFMGFAIWRIWDRAALAQLFRREEARERPIQLRLLVAFWALLLLVAFRIEDLFAGLTDPAQSWWDRGESIVWTLVVLVVWAGVVPWAASRAGVYKRVMERDLVDRA